MVDMVDMVDIVDIVDIVDVVDVVDVVDIVDIAATRSENMDMDTDIVICNHGCVLSHGR